MADIRAIIWDLGGVLVRTEDLKPRESLASRLGMNTTELEHLVFSSDSGIKAQLGEISIDQHWENLSRLLNQSVDDMITFQRDFWGGDHLDTALIDFIRSLRSTYKTGLLSNAFSDLRYVITDIWGFSDAFDHMIISSEVGEMKPNPRIYQITLGCFGFKPQEVVLIDDFQINLLGARKMGMIGIQFNTPEQVISELKRLTGEK